MKRLLNLSVALLISVFTFSQGATQMIVQGFDPKARISPEIYGHFSEDLGHCIYGGFWVDDSLDVPKTDRIRMDIVNALKEIHIPLLRWPGGCYADMYHWRDGIGARDKRPRTVNADWGMVTEDNSFGTHEFLELCSLLGCQPYIAGNVGSGTVKEMSNWIEYLNFDGNSSLANLRRQDGRDKPWKVSYWGVGNESWGCGGEMTPEYYADQYRRYSEFCKNYPGAPLKLIASGPNGSDYHWMDVLMKNISLGRTWGVSLHYYTVAGDWHHKGSATHFDEKEYFSTMKKCLFMDDLVSRQSAIMDAYDSGKKVALCVDEWGIWTDAEPGTNPAFLYQQNSLRDALVAATTLNIFNNHCDRVRLACLAQSVNVLQALVLTDKEKMLLTPTYYVFDLYKVHQGATLLPVQIKSPGYSYDNDQIPAVNVSASKDSNGVVHITLVNLDPSHKIPVRSTLQDVQWKTVTGQILTSPKFTDINTFDDPYKVKPAKFSNAKKEGGDLVVDLPPMSVVLLELK